jgi:hypothetical protein
MGEGLVTEGKNPAGHAVIAGRQADLPYDFFQPTLGIRKISPVNVENLHNPSLFLLA